MVNAVDGAAQGILRSNRIALYGQSGDVWISRDQAKNIPGRKIRRYFWLRHGALEAPIVGGFVRYNSAQVGRAISDPTTDAEPRLAPGMAIVVIGVLSLFSWGLLISIVMVLRSSL